MELKIGFIFNVKSSAGTKLSVGKNIEEVNILALKPVPHKTASEVISNLIPLTQASYQKKLANGHFLKGKKS